MSNYWTKRFEEEEKQRNISNKAYTKEIEKQYKIAENKIKSDIEKWYIRIADNNQISLADAKKLLTKDELKEFKWTLAEYTQKAKSGAWKKELENASARIHIQRLEALQLQVKNSIETLRNKENEMLEDYLIKNYEDTYYHSLYEISKGLNLKTSFATLDKNKINQVIGKPWLKDGKTFSDRIWQDKEQLINTLRTKITQSFITGSTLDEAVEDISKFVSDKIKNKEYVARRLLETESAAYASKAQIEAFKSIDVEKYEIVATLDLHTSEICQEMDGKVFNISDQEIGVTVPPFHSHCYDKTTEIYTNEGWKLFKDLKGNELVYTINPGNLEPEWQKPINYISYKYQGNMISFKNSRFDLVVTPNHSIFVQNTDNTVKDKSWKLKEASKVGRKSKHRMFSGLNWNGIKKEYEILAGKKVDINTYLKFMAYWLSDGSCTFDRNSFNVKIAQYNNDWMYEELKDLPFKIYKCKESLMIHNKELGEELSKFGKCTTKFIPDNIKELSSELIRIFLIAYSKADGTLKKGKIWKGYKFNDSIQFFTSSDKLASDLGELILKAGGRPSYYLNKCAGKEIEFKNGVYTINKDVWTIRWNTQVHNYLYNMEITDIEYDDYVYCVEVPKHNTLLVRRNGKVCWSGNCRTVIAPYFDDDPTRASRDENGEYKEVKYMNYKEWKDQYIKKEVIERVPDEELKRKLPRLTRQKEEFTRQKEKITCYKATGTKNKIYVEEKTKNSLMIDDFNNKTSVKESITYIDDTLSKAFKTMGMDKNDFGDLKVIVMTKENTFASYYPKGNVIYINPVYLGSERTYNKIFDSGILKSLTNSDNILSNYIHELTHTYENMYYKKFHKGKDILKIKEENLKKILAFAKESKYNIEKEISLYAYENKTDISELLAEAYTRKKLDKSNLLIEYILDLYGLGE
jgi:phage protein